MCKHKRVKGTYVDRRCVMKQETGNGRVSTLLQVMKDLFKCFLWPGKQRLMTNIQLVTRIYLATNTCHNKIRLYKKSDHLQPRQLLETLDIKLSCNEISTLLLLTSTASLFLLRLLVEGLVQHLVF